MTKIITAPDIYSPEMLLATIEGTPSAFTMGRRNNDMVNWFIAHRLIDLDNPGCHEPGGYAMIKDYQTRLTNLMTIRLSQEQRAALETWETDRNLMVERLCRHYSGYTSERLCSIWLPMDYRELTTQQDRLPGLTPLPVKEGIA